MDGVDLSNPKKDGRLFEDARIGLEALRLRPCHRAHRNGHTY